MDWSYQCVCLIFWLFLICSVEPATDADQSQVIGSSHPVLAVAGDDVILPCHLEPAADVFNMIVEWSKTSLVPPYVHIHREGRLLSSNQNPLYRYRTTLFTEELDKGNISLRLSRVRLSDEGKYRCLLLTLKSQAKESTIQLIVVTQPEVSIVELNDSGVVLLCESKGWYPQPKVEWRDRDGSILSAGDTETLRDPDGLYTVRRRVTVKQTDTDTNRFTCRVQQQHINQTRETQIHVPVSSKQPNFSAKSIGIGIIIGIIIGISVVIFGAISVVFLKRRRAKSRTERRYGEMQNDDDDTMKLVEKDDLTKTKEALEKTVSELQSKLQKKEEVLQRKDWFIKTKRCYQIMRSLDWLYSSDQDVLHVTDLQKYILDLIPHLHHLKALEESYIDKNIQTIYAQTVTCKFFFFLDPQQNGEVRIKDILECPFLDELLELRDEELSKERLESNWFSVPSFQRLYNQYHILNKDHSMKLTKEQLSQYGTDKLSGVLLDQVYKVSSLTENNLNFKMYLSFVLALENRKEPVALQNILILLDIEKRETLDKRFLNCYFKAIQEQRRIHGLEQVPFKDDKDKILHILNLDNTSSITFKDLLASDHADQVINILIDLNKLCTDGNSKMPVANDDSNSAESSRLVTAQGFLENAVSQNVLNGANEESHGIVD